jgi:predicted membrane protein
MKILGFITASIVCLIYIFLYVLLRILLFKDLNNLGALAHTIETIIFVFIPCAFIWRKVIDKMNNKISLNKKEVKPKKKVNPEKIYQYYKLNDLHHQRLLLMLY